MTKLILSLILATSPPFADDFGDEDDYGDEEIVAAIERQTEAIETAIEEQTFQQQLDAVLIQDAIENSHRDRWYWRNW